MSVTTPLSSAANAYLAAGLCALPAIRAEKRPAVGAWRQFRGRLPAESELSAWLARSPDALCIVCGAVSGNAEMIDFDAHGELFDAWSGQIPPDLLSRLVIERSPSGGCHVFYRCGAPVCGNMKLAQRKDGDKIATLIETRGEGGIFLCAPTPGYVPVQGELHAPPLVTEAERDALLTAAWTLNEYLPPVLNGPRSLADNAHNGRMPSDISDIGGSPLHNSDIGRVRSDIPHTAPRPSDISDNAPSRLDIPHSVDVPSDNSHIAASPPHNPHTAAHDADIPHRPGDDFNRRGDVRAILAQAGWALVKPGENEYWRRPGKSSGWSASLKDGVFYVFSANAAPFDPNRAYSPFAVYTMLNHGGDYETAARTLRLSGFGGDPASDIHHDVDISGIMRMSVAQPASQSHNAHPGQMCDSTVAQGAPASHNSDPSPVCEISEADEPPPPEIPDPGSVPADMLRIPGFVGEVMDHCLETAPYPNPVMAFAGALTLQAFLAGRKVRDPGDNRTNVYLLGLAHSSAGKDWPRKINTRIAHEVGLASAFGERFASGEGIQDALFQTPSMLFQTDEIDGMLQSINKAKDARHEAVMSTLLTMYSSSNSVYPMRRKAGKESPGVINQPNLVIFGTAIPNHYYEALSERMLTNGFFARMIILEAGARPSGQEPTIRALPPRVLATAKWWGDYRPGTGNLENWNPVPAVVEHTDEARRLLIETREQAEAEYATAESRGDPVGTTVWGRVSEQTRKLALIHAVSENHRAPRIGLAAVEWASAFVMHQTRRMLFMAAGHVADNPFHAECLKALDRLRAAPGGVLPHSVLLKRMKMDSKTFTVLVETLAEQGDISIVQSPQSGRGGRPTLAYRLTGQGGAA